MGSKSSSTSRWLDGLNDAQKEAVLHDRGPLLILAGAGSGKTTVLVARAGRLLDEGDVSPERLCVLTFTNKAARELKTRVAARLGKRAEGILAGTFHSFGLQLLRQYHEEAGLPKFFGIIDARDGAQICKELLRNLKQGEKTAYDADRMLSILSRWRESGQTEADTDDEYDVAAEWLLPRYADRLHALGVVDFDGLILRPLELMAKSTEIRAAIQSRFDYVMVDEFQDTNTVQMRLIRTLVEQHKNLTVVGDDDQAIYGWRGACVANILDFPKTYRDCKIVKLETNYRSTAPILALANAVIKKNAFRHDKTLRPGNTSTEAQIPELFLLQDEAEELEHVVNEIHRLEGEGFRKEDIAVLFRSNTQGALLEAELRRCQIPYRMRGGTGFFDRKETRDVMAYLRSALRPSEVAFRRILNTPPRGIGDRAVATIHAAAVAKKQPFVRLARQWGDLGLDPRAGKAIDQLFAHLDGLVARLTTAPPSSELMRFLEEIGYRKYLDKHSPDATVATRRWRFVEMFAEVMEKYTAKAGSGRKALGDFLDAMELRDPMEEDEENPDKIHLLTLHACKGLEFPAVLLTGVEEDILPHRTLGTDISEERRLFYVGVTRAQKRLILSHVRQRRRHGKTVPVPPSRFLNEAPSELLARKEGLRPANAENRKAMLSALFAKLDELDAQPR